MRAFLKSVDHLTPDRRSKFYEQESLLIFEDPLRRRWQRTRFIFLLLLTTTLVSIALFITGLIMPPPVPDPFANLSPLHARRFADFLDTEIDWYYNSESAPHPLNQAPAEVLQQKQIKSEQEAVFAAFIVDEDFPSSASLEKHIDQLDIVIPDWFSVPGKSCELSENINPRTRQILKNRGVLVYPRVTNLAGYAWSDSTGRLLRSDRKRNCLVKKITERLIEIGADGVNLDFEHLHVEDKSYFVLFVNELKISFRPHRLKLSVDVSLFDPAQDILQIGKAADLVMVMAYDEHHSGTGPGPISSQRWFRYQVDEMIDYLGTDKVMIILGAYGYDWTDSNRKPAQSISFRHALDLAAEHNSTITFARGGENSKFSYRDEKKISHEVYFQDSLSFYNQIRYCRSKGLSKFGIWRAGTEDENIWNVLDENASAEDVLTEILPVRSIEFSGDGEVLSLEEEPHPGEIDLKMRDDGSIESAKYDVLPSGFNVRRRKGGERKLLLTFDDGPTRLWTEDILKTLKYLHCPAVFFVVGEQVTENPDLVVEAARDGHYIGNHTFSHPHIEAITQREAGSQISTTSRLIGALTGSFSPLFRPPYTASVYPESPGYSAIVRPALQMGYTIIGANVDSLDWKRPGVQAIADRVWSEVHAGRGQIILLHDGGGPRDQTAEALKIFVPRLRSEGYEFVSVDKFLNVPKNRLLTEAPYSENILSTGSAVIFFIKRKAWIVLAFLFFTATFLSIGRILVLGSLALLGIPDDEEKTQKYAPFASVIIPAFNEEKVIARTLQALQKTDYKNFEILVIDDGSTDRTSEVVERLAQKNKKIKIFKRANGGKAQAANFGLKKARGEIIIAIDADTLVSSDAISSLVRHFDSPEVAAVCGNVEVGNVKSPLTAFQAIEYVTSQNFDRRAFSALNCISVVPGALGAWRRSRVIEAGGWSEDSLTEDADLTLTILRRGGRIVYEPKARGRTEAPETLGALLKQRFRWTYGTYQCLWKHRSAFFHGSLGWAGLPNMLLFQIIFPILSPIGDAVMVLSLFRSDWPAFLSGYIAFLIMDLAGSLLAFHLDKKPLKWLFLLLIQRFTYRQIMYWVSFKAMLAAVRGARHGWQKLERTGSVAAG